MFNRSWRTRKDHGKGPGKLRFKSPREYEPWGCHNYVEITRPNDKLSVHMTTGSGHEQCGSRVPSPPPHEGPFHIVLEEKCSFISLLRFAIHTNLSRKRSFSTTLLKPEEFENGAFGQRWHYDIHVISLPEFSSSSIPSHPEATLSLAATSACLQVLNARCSLSLLTRSPPCLSRLSSSTLASRYLR